MGHLVDSNEQNKRQFAERVWFKNYLRSFALYNFVIENLARNYYGLMKARLVPGTNFAQLSREDVENRYEGFLQRLLSHVRSRNVKPMFVLFCGFNRETGRYDKEGPYERKFAEFAQKNGIPMLRSDEVLRRGEPENVDLAKYFIDLAHMNELGTQKVAERLAKSLPDVLDH